MSFRNTLRKFRAEYCAPFPLRFAVVVVVPLLLLAATGRNPVATHSPDAPFDLVSVLLLPSVGIILGLLLFRRNAHVGKGLSLHTRPVEQHLPGKHILWVEGDDDNREIVAHLLWESGYRVTSARNSFEALLFTMTQHCSPLFDVYVLGDWLPYGEESSLCRHLHKADPGCPIIFLSSAAQLSDRQRGLQAGAQRYLCKPLEVTLLSEVIAELLSPATGASAKASGSFRTDFRPDIG